MYRTAANCFRKNLFNITETLQINQPVLPPPQKNKNKKKYSWNLYISAINLIRACFAKDGKKHMHVIATKCFYYTAIEIHAQ